MVMSNFLSRQTHDKSNPHEIIPISFNMHNVLHKNYYNLGEIDNYLVQMHSQTKSSGIKLPEVHCMRKNLDPNILLEKQTCQSHKWQKNLNREATHRSRKNRNEKGQIPSN